MVPDVHSHSVGLEARSSALHQAYLVSLKQKNPGLSQIREASHADKRTIKNTAGTLIITREEKPKEKENVQQR